MLSDRDNEKGISVSKCTLITHHSYTNWNVRTECVRPMAVRGDSQSRPAVSTDSHRPKLVKHLQKISTCKQLCTLDTTTGPGSPLVNLLGFSYI